MVLFHWPSACSQSSHARDVPFPRVSCAGLYTALNEIARELEDPFGMSPASQPASQRPLSHPSPTKLRTNHYYECAHNWLSSSVDAAINASGHDVHQLAIKEIHMDFNEKLWLLKCDRQLRNPWEDMDNV